MVISEFSRPAAGLLAALSAVVLASAATASPLQISKVSSAGACVALTFDDGPDATLTPQLLDTLQQKRVPATFFVIGQRAATWPDVVAREAQEGNEVGNHTWDHQYLTKLGNSDAIREISRTDDVVQKITGQKPSVIRAPYGSMSERVAGLDGRYFINWSVDTRDWEYPNVDRIVNEAVSGASDGAIILLHDIHPKSVAAVPAIIDGIRARGFTFGTVSQLLSGTCGSSGWGGGFFAAFSAPMPQPQPAGPAKTVTVASAPKPAATTGKPAATPAVQEPQPLFPVLSAIFHKPPKVP